MRKENQENINPIKTKQQDPNTIYNTAQLTEKPEFVGGMENFYKFVGENYTKPKTPEEVKLAGKVYVTFIIEADGNLSNFKILRDIGYGTGEEAIRVLKLCPKWNPGELNGEAVRTLYSLPISIQSKT
ncbi:MAG: energy transducer TonB [Flavobacterium sp.]